MGTREARHHLIIIIVIIIIIIIIITFIYTAKIQLCSFQMRLTIKDQKAQYNI